MNTKNNKRRRDSVERIQNAFVSFLQTKDLHEITVSDICKEAGINRSTFYANFMDVYDLSEKIINKLQDDLIILYHDEIVKGKYKSDYVKLFIMSEKIKLCLKSILNLKRTEQIRNGFIITKN